MGADISLCIEIKDKSRKWHIVKKPAFPCPICKEESKYYPEYLTEGCYWCKDNTIRITRNYMLFTALAGVRKWSLPKGWKTISEPKGIPKNASAEVKEYLEDEDVHSYYTYSQLKKYNWEEVDDGQFTNIVIPLLKNLSEKHGGDSKVRIVFGFNS